MLAGGEKSRVDTRVTAMLQGALRDARGTTRQVRIGDLSPKGMLIACERPPQRGEIVDVTINGHHLAGQVMWANGRRCGIRTRERIDVHAVVNGRRANRRVAGKRIEESNDPDKWSQEKLLVAYGLLGLTAFATAYLIVTYLIL